MLKPVHAIAAFALSACAATAVSAQDAPRVAMAIGAATAAQHGGSWQPGPGWDRDIEVRCESRGHAYSQCQVDTGQGGRVALVRQTSMTQCIEGRNWGWNRAGVWVDQGCSGVFRVQRRWADGRGPNPGAGGPGGWRPGSDWDRNISVRCSSSGYNYNMCQVDTGRGSRVYLQRQLSGTSCVEGRNWGWNRAGIWVDQGCSGVFVVERRWR